VSTTITDIGQSGTPAESRQDSAAAHQPVALVDLLDRLLGAGVMLSGDITISIAGIDLVEVRLHALITSVRAEMRSTDPTVSRTEPREVIR